MAAQVFLCPSQLETIKVRMMRFVAEAVERSGAAGATNPRLKYVTPARTRDRAEVASTREERQTLCLEGNASPIPGLRLSSQP